MHDLYRDRDAGHVQQGEYTGQGGGGALKEKGTILY